MYFESDAQEMINASTKGPNLIGTFMKPGSQTGLWFYRSI